MFHVHSQLVLFARFGVFRFVIVKAWKVALQGANREADEVLSPNQCVIKDEACSPRSTEVGERGGGIGQFRFLGNCRPTALLTQHFALSEK